MSNQPNDQLMKLIGAIEVDATPEQIAQALGLIDTMKRTLKEAKDMFDAAIRPHLALRPITVGTTLIYLGKTRKVVCKDVQATVERLLTEVGGDLGALVNCLASDPVKQGGFKQIVGDEEWAKYFDVIVGDKVELKQVDTRFLE